MSRPTEAQVLAAARCLYQQGLEHGWWPENCPQRFEDLDEIGREEFEAIAERTLVAADMHNPASTTAISAAASTLAHAAASVGDTLRDRARVESAAASAPKQKPAAKAKSNAKT